MTKEPKVNTPPLIRGSYHRHRVTVPIETEGSLTQQSGKDECDINRIMKKYEREGLFDHVNKHQGSYGNFIGFQDYQTSQNQILEAQAAFETIPSAVRKKFDNSPVKFLEFAQNPDNLDEMIELGLANARPAAPEGEAPTAGPQPPEPPQPTPGTAAAAPGEPSSPQPVGENPTPTA